MTPLVRPPRLRAGSKLAVVSPAGNAANRYPGRLERGVDAIRAAGFVIRVMPHATATGRYTAGTAEERVMDLMEAFRDPTVDGIVCAIGGQLSSELLGLIDFDVVATHPKVFCGYSDVTTLHAAFGKAGRLVTFYGPAVMTDWAELPGPASEMVECFTRVTSVSDPLGPLVQPPWEVVEHVDWGDDRVRQTGRARETRSLREGAAAGRLVGGCLPVLCELLGTPWFPEIDDCILYVEFPPAPYSPASAAVDLWHLRNASKLQGIAALVIGRPHLGQLLEEFDDAVLDATRGLPFPITSGIACGHTLPNLTLPLGLQTQLEGTRLTVVEPAVV